MKRISLVTVIVMPLFVIPGAAIAGDAKVSPGTMCLTEAGFTPGNYRGGSYDYSGTTPNHPVTCPIVRDENSGVLREVRVRLLHRAPGSSSASCRVYSQADDAGSRDETQPKTHAASGSSSTELIFTTDSLGHFNGGTFAVLCSLGQNFEIMSVRYSEDP